MATGGEEGSAEVRMRVLIADDDPGMREILMIFMDRAGHDAVTAEDGLKALDLLDKDPYDVVITDGVMPEMTGFELCRTVRERFPRILVIGLTGSSRLHEFEKAGAHVCYYKPVTFSVINQAMEMHFSASQAAAI
jgi:two-component system sensor histidine kinase EvgS